MALRSVCVFCGASDGRATVYRRAASALGSALAEGGVTLVFGGGRVGMMGAVADAALAAGGRVIGVIPEALRLRELAHSGVHDMRVVPDMHSRKALMTQLADAIVALPGGLGTYDELLEALTWAQLGFHSKPIGILDAGGYFEPFVAMVEHARRERFIGPSEPTLFRVETDPRRLLAGLAAGVMSRESVPAPVVRG